jgi:2,3-diaminopropionate biosynthesis protein SbnA
MPIVTRPEELHCDDVYVDLQASAGIPLFLKCEGLNVAGSMKLRVAAAMVDRAEHEGLVTPGTTLVESSSGNLGIALALVAASRSIPFVCVVDPKCNQRALDLMRSLGATVHLVHGPDEAGGYLSARKSKVQQLCEQHPDYLWLNQYQNPAAWNVHADTTAPQIARDFPSLDVVFIGVGTGGTLRGCAQYFHEHHPNVTVVAVDSVGSVNFGMPSGPRHLPGLGAGEQMPFVAKDLADDFIAVSEEDAISCCLELAEHGFLLGASTGTVVFGAREWLSRNAGRAGRSAVAIAPDFGERYLETVYDEEWRRKTFDSYVRKERP